MLLCDLRRSVAYEPKNLKFYRQKIVYIDSINRGGSEL